MDDRITLNEVRNGSRAISAWHHHGHNTGYVHVLGGRLRVEWGYGGDDSAELAAGDFYVISPHTIHREANPGDDDQLVIAFAVGSGPKVVDVDGPESAPEPTREAGGIRICRRDDMPAGPPSRGMTRSIADVDDDTAVGTAQNAPGTKSGWHSHGRRTVCTYVVRGQTHLEWGPAGRDSADLTAGDFYVVYPNTIHRETNLGADDQLLVAFYLGGGDKVVNVEGPEPHPL